ncbi:MAG: MFS transporter [Acidimicrobiia bacterium]
MTGSPTGGRTPLWGLLLADSISLTGNTLTMVAVPWFVLQTTGSAVQTGLAGAALVLPNLLSGFLTGPVVDRLGLRKASIVSDLASGATVAAIPMLHLSGALTFETLLGLVFLGTFLDIPGETARKALLPDVALLAGTSLERTTSVREGAARVAQMAAGPLAGFLIALIGPAQVLLVDAATFGLSALLVWGLVPARKPVQGQAVGGYLSQLREGLRFIWDDRLIRAVLAMVMITNLLDYGVFAVLFPLYADEVLGGPTALGLIIGAFGIGSVLGAVVYGAVGDRLPKRLTFLLAFLIGGSPRLFLLAAQPGLEVILPSYLVLGIATGAINPLLLVVAYQRIPAVIRGRAFGVTRAAAWGAMPLGTILAGYLADAFGLRATVFVFASAYLLASLSPAIGKVWLQMDDVGTRPDRSNRTGESGHSGSVPCPPDV